MRDRSSLYYIIFVNFETSTEKSLNTNRRNKNDTTTEGLLDKLKGGKLQKVLVWYALGDVKTVAFILSKV